MTASTSRPINRPKKPKTSSRSKSGTTAAQSRLTTLSERTESAGKAIMIHGPTGVGKTVLAIHKAPRPILVLDADNGIDSVIGTTRMDDIHIWSPSDGVRFTYEDLDEFRNYVVAGDWEMSYKTIVPDNITAAQKPFIPWAIAQRAARQTDVTKRELIDPDIPSQNDWGKIYRTYDRWIRDLRDAKRRGAHIIFTAGSYTWMDEEAGYEKIMPDLEGREREQVPTHMDAVCYYAYEDDDDESSDRILHLAPSGAVVTKARVPIALHNKIPSEVRNPDFKAMMAAVTVVEREAKKAAAKTTRKKR